jgi:hypothetical protein
LPVRADCDHDVDVSERDPRLEPFDALIGTWATESTHPMVDAAVPGAAWQLARTPDDWQDDLTISWRRI